MCGIDVLHCYIYTYLCRSIWIIIWYTYKLKTHAGSRGAHQSRGFPKLETQPCPSRSVLEESLWDMVRDGERGFVVSFLGGDRSLIRQYQMFWFLEESLFPSLHLSGTGSIASSLCPCDFTRANTFLEVFLSLLNCYAGTNAQTHLLG